MEEVNNLSQISSKPYISLGNDNPGITGLFLNDPKHGNILSQLAEYLLVDDHEMPKHLRELIAAYVSKINNCNFCYNSHKQICFATATLEEGSFFPDGEYIEAIKDVLEKDDFEGLYDKYKWLLVIAQSLAVNVQGVTQDMIDQAIKFGATEGEILRTVQIASAFCMYNRYVDGLGTIPNTPEGYANTSVTIAENGYIAPFVQG